MFERRRKLWGWGYEDQQASRDEFEGIGRGAREHLGFEPVDVEHPPRLEDLELPPPRLEPPPALASICSTEPYARATHAYGKAYRDLVRALRGRFDNPPDVVAYPADEADLERVLEWCVAAGAAAIPYGGGTSVVGGVEPRVEQPAARHDRPRPPGPGARRRSGLARRAHPGGRHRPRAGGAAARRTG